MLKPVHLRTLIAVVRTGSFANAARQLEYTPSAVSQQVAALERALGMQLFERDAHSIRATPSGEFVAGRAHDALAAFVSLDDELRGFTQGQLGRLRIAGLPGIVPRAGRQELASLLAVGSAHQANAVSDCHVRNGSRR